MSAGLILLVLVIGLAVVAVVAAPFVRPERDPDRGQSDRLAELDLRTGKLSRQDHRAIDRELRREAIEILEQIDAEKETI